MRRAAHLIVLAGSLLAFACRREASPPSTAALPDPGQPLAQVARDTHVTDERTELAERAERAEEERSDETCIAVDDDLGGTHITLEGRVVVDDTFEHPSRGKTHPYILQLDTPRCATGIDELSVRELHLTASEDIPLKPLVGAHVRVSGDPFVAHTAWHARPIVLMATSAAPISR
jgi:hypothetical protein